MAVQPPTMRCTAIHAHFYQPPRENPWVGVDDSGADGEPDWNRRITDECYAPNAAARILDERGAVRRTVNNYARLSFNVGPTLAAWLARNAPEVWREILDGDRAHRSRGDGGAVLAQPYAHPILPLCTRREKRLQLLWGIQDFEHRFGRRPEGVWLPETAVDGETLETVADLGIRFTILAPHQAKRVRGPGDESWSPLGSQDAESRRGYRHELPGDRSVEILFYDRPVSQGIAFEGLLESGVELASRLGRRLDGAPEGEPVLALVATDGETYGHHHRFGEMALATALEALELDTDRALTTPGAFLAAHPPRWAVEIAPRTSWSCPHGVVRWHADCGCGSAGGDESATGQAWRGPLRDALDHLRDRAAELLLTRGWQVLADPEAAAEDYGRVVADGTGESLEAFLRRHARRPDDEDARREVLGLMEMQRHALLMFASCGWFFGALDRPEPVLCLRHAARAAELAGALGAGDVEDALLRDLALVPGPSAEIPDGAALWRLRVLPARTRASSGGGADGATGR